MWEVPLLDLKVILYGGITPTCVGSTLWCVAYVPFYEDHPHVCGKYLNVSESTVGKWGSPPRVWEVLTQRQISLKLGRITPTCVGST